MANVCVVLGSVREGRMGLRVASCFVIILIKGICMINDHLGGMIIIMILIILIVGTSTVIIRVAEVVRKFLWPLLPSPKGWQLLPPWSRLS